MHLTGGRRPMLRQLAIRDVVLVDQLELEFEAGLGVLTGETGAGKSILLDALGLALGARADTGLVRSGAGRRPRCRAEIELAGRPSRRMRCSPSRASSAEPGEPLLLRRSLKADGGSRAFVGGAAVPAGVAARHRRAGGRDPRPARRPRPAQSRAATARCSTPSAGSTSAPVAAAWAEVDAARSASLAQARAKPPRRRARPRLSRPCLRRDRGARARGRRGDQARRGAGGDAGGAQGRRER